MPANVSRKLVLEFTKMSGAGNDFIVIDNRFYHFSDQELSGLARQWCARRFGVGADGLLAFSKPANPGHHFRMRYFNADGTLGTMCGNGARCLARFAQMVGVEAEYLILESDAGLYRAYVPAGPDMPVRLYIPAFRDYQPDRALESEAAVQAGPIHYIWTGTEHVVAFVEAAEVTPVEEWGPPLRCDAGLGPAGANVNFVEVVTDGMTEGRSVLRVRTFEKGVEAETLACGTGAMASALVAYFLGYIATETIDVQMWGGTLTIGFEREDKTLSNLYLEGPATAVYRGTLEV